jgi:hypothetical protein
MAYVAPNTLFNQILDFLSSTPTPEAILAFRPSSQLQARASELLEKNRAGNLSDEDRTELDEFQRLNHFMSMLKIRASEKVGAI